MTNLDPKEYSKYLFIVFFAILAYLSYLMVAPFLTAIIASLIVGYAFFPIYKILMRFVKNRVISASLMTGGVMLVLLIPLVLIANLLIKESIALYSKIDIVAVSEFISTLFKNHIDGYISQFFEKAANYIIGITSNLALSIPQKALATLIFLFVLFFTFKDSDKVKKLIMHNLPVDKSYKDKIKEQFRSTMDAVVYGTISIAIIQGVVGMIGFAIFGITSPVLWGLITAVLAMLPFIGPAAVWIPLAIYQYALGNIYSAIGIALYGLIILSILLDMILKPRLIAKKGRIHPITALLGVLGGISVMGVTGLILGPFLLSLFVFFIGILMEKK